MYILCRSYLSQSYKYEWMPGLQSSLMMPVSSTDNAQVQQAIKALETILSPIASSSERASANQVSTSFMNQSSFYFSIVKV